MEPVAAGAAEGIHVGDDPGDPLGRDADAGGARVRDRDKHPDLEDYILGCEGFPGGVDAP